MSKNFIYNQTMLVTIKKGRLKIIIYLITNSYGLIIVIYVHTGIQDGKGSLDAHFANAIMHIIRYVNMGFNVVTSVELVNALHENGGISNTHAKIIGINCPQIKLIETTNQVLI